MLFPKKRIDYVTQNLSAISSIKRDVTKFKYKRITVNLHI